MPISRSQMERQLRMGGGIMSLEPRQNYGLGSIVKSVTKGVKSAVKGAASAVKDVAKSDLGKAALTAAALYYGGGGNLFGLQRAGMSGFSLGNLPGASFFGKGSLNPLRMLGPATSDGIMTQLSPFGQALSKFGLATGANQGTLTGLGKTVGIAGLSGLAGFMSQQGMSEEEIEQVSRNPEALKVYLRQYYSQLNPDAGPMQIDRFVEANTAEYRADGGRIGYAYGDRAEDNAIQASGIEGIPLNINPAGATELDMRETGGFIPPVGVKEKADDIPAMLSNNEFVMTADAVREFGDGDVNKGAERMYAMMKTLENGGRV